MDTRQNILSINEKLESKLKNGNKVFSLVMMSDFGGVCVMPLKLLKTEIKRYAQYETALYIEFLPKGKRKARYTYLHGGQEFAFFVGDVTPTEKMPSSWCCFDKNLFYKIVDSTQGEKVGEESERQYIDELKQKGKIYKVYGVDFSETYESEAELLKHYEKTGTHSGSYTRYELQNTPILKGLCGAMYDGEQDGKAVIRYETPELYNILSN